MICPLEIASDLSALRAARVADHGKHGWLLEDPSVYSSDANSGTPWIMWAGTPYEHLMIPVK